MFSYNIHPCDRFSVFVFRNGLRAAELQPVRHGCSTYLILFPEPGQGLKEQRSLCFSAEEPSGSVKVKRV